MGWGYDWKPYVPVAQRRANAAREIAKKVKKGESVSPVVIAGRKIVSTFWGEAWCANLESYSDFANRLPRGRTYVRNGSVAHMKVVKGRIESFVSGSELYTVEIEISALPKNAWTSLKRLCAGKIGSLVELLQGKLSKGVMEAVTDRAEGLFPKPKEIEMSCSCPDYAGMCKHIAAVMYGIGNRLDKSPELLFELRGVDHRELIEQAIPTAPTHSKPAAAMIDASDLGAIFDIELGDTPDFKTPTPETKKPTAAKATKVEKTKVGKATKAKTAPAKTEKVEKLPSATKPAPAVKAAAKKAPTTKAATVEKPVTTAKTVGKKTAKVKKAEPAAKAADAKKSTPSKQPKKTAVVAATAEKTSKVKNSAAPKKNVPVSKKA